MRIVLIGPRGCGKTTIGRRLAQRLRCDFVDLDDVAASHFDESSINDIWSTHGESAWRTAELSALRETLQDESDRIIALGGGTPAILEARQALLKEKARNLRIVYLRCPPEELARRLTREPGDRPSMTGRGMVEEIAAVLAEREPIYQAIADEAIDAGGEADAVATVIEKSIR